MNRKISATLVILAAIAATLITPAHAGNISGPIGLVNVLPPGMQHYYDVVLVAGLPTFISVFGDGSTDLDIFVYDQNGFLIASDNRPFDQCRVVVSPYWTGPFRIVVVNRGPFFNRYVLETN